MFNDDTVTEYIYHLNVQTPRLVPLSLYLVPVGVHWLFISTYSGPVFTVWVWVSFNTVHDNVFLLDHNEEDVMI